ncbi:MAG: hypothetical protein KJ709_01070 [Nanoarchaeota archaeon]|nr:hypothetical protein [Nanoarchaeota archaeon]
MEIPQREELPEMFFPNFKEEDYIILELESTGTIEDLIADQVAEAIIRASEKGQKPVSLKMPNREFYEKEWCNLADISEQNTRMVYDALDELGWDADYWCNDNHDGMYFFLWMKGSPEAQKH